MPFPMKKTTPPTDGGSKGAVDYLAGASNPMGQEAEETNMNDPCYKIVHGAVIQFGADKVQQCLDQCKQDEASEEIAGGSEAPAELEGME